MLLSKLDTKNRATVLKLAREVQSAGGRAYIVGGIVRDYLLDFESKDVDVEVFGLDADILRSLLKEHFSVNEFGRSFGVFKIDGLGIDIAVPRRESKLGFGHRGFEVSGDPYMSLEEAASRRDFTCNAIYFDILEEKLSDPCGGIQDMRQCILRHVGPQFSEDPLRVLRAMQFAARFNYRVAPETVELCRSIQPEGLPVERLFEEWSKLFLKGRKISLGLRFLRDCGWLQYYPELERLVGCPQDPKWHPEGDVWEHTLCSLDSFAENRIGIDREDLIIAFSVLCHDFGKPETTLFKEGRWRSPRHEYVGVRFVESFLNSIVKDKGLIQSVLPLVRYHMSPSQFFRSNAGDSAIRRLSLSVGRIDRLIRLADADMKGTPPNHRSTECLDWLREKSDVLCVQDAAPDPIVLGRHLIQLGRKPGPDFKAYLNECYEAQLDGIISDEITGIAYLKKLIS